MNPGGSQRHGRSHDGWGMLGHRQGHQGEQEEGGVRTQTGYEGGFGKGSIAEEGGYRGEAKVIIKWVEMGFQWSSENWPSQMVMSKVKKKQEPEKRQRSQKQDSQKYRECFGGDLAAIIFGQELKLRYFQSFTTVQAPKKSSQ